MEKSLGQALHFILKLAFIFLGILSNQPSFAQKKVPILIPVESCQESNSCEQIPPKELIKNPEITTNPEPEVLRIKLFEDSGSSEWIRLEKNGNVIKILHTRSRPNELTRFLARAFFFPQIYNWDDHPASRIVFTSDDCSDFVPHSSRSISRISESKTNDPNCIITSSSDTITLKDGTDIRKGSFTIEYTESNLARTVTFKVGKN